MEKLSIIDVLTLAKAGYKRKDIDEIIAANAAAEETAEDATKEIASPEPQKVQEETPEADSTPDYKAMFEEMQSKYEEINKKLEAAQKANTARDASTTQTKASTSETINNIFREIIS